MTFQDFIYKYQKEKVKEFPNKVIEHDVLVTVCVFTYNHIKYIKQCLDGILMQKTRFHYEIYLGEDESTDGTREICLEYAQNYPDKIRLILHSRANNIIISGNPSGRFNSLYAYLTARGKYIAICEGDDYWTDENKLQKQVDLIEKETNVTLVCHNVVSLQDSTGNMTLRFKEEEIPDEEITLADMLKKNFASTPTVLIKSEIIKSAPDWVFREKVGDYFLWCYAASKGVIRYIHEAMAVYRVHEQGTWSRYSNRQRIHLEAHNLLRANEMFCENKKEKQNRIDELNLLLVRNLRINKFKKDASYLSLKLIIKSLVRGNFRYIIKVISEFRISQ